MNFSLKIIQWYQKNKRDLPWRKTKDPYHIWLSEIVLQQTRVDQGIVYYERFLEHFPTLFDLASATEEQVLKLWQGLGYYTRARNLHQTAKIVSEKYDGIFPEKYEEILHLPGVGPYTASAIASFSFNQVYPVVDGNVLRVLSRYYGMDQPIDTDKGKKNINTKANELIDNNQPGIYNQAIMELGALICTPKNFKCNICPLQDNCIAFNTNITETLPVKSKKVKIKNRYFNYLVLHITEQKKIFTVIKKRTKNDVWKNLYDFPLVETSKTVNWKQVISNPRYHNGINTSNINFIEASDSIRHKLTHQHIYAKFFHFKIKRSDVNMNEAVFTDFDDILKYPMPKLMENYIVSLKEKMKYF